MSADRRPGPAVELRHIRYFLAVVEEMNFGRAAERLGIAQPGLSQQIKALEGIIGTRLFDRSRRAVSLTPAGELFAIEANKTVAQSERAILLAQQAGRGEIGRIVIGYVGSAAYAGMLTKIIKSFRQDHPRVELEIGEMEMAEQMVRLAERRLDIGFVRPPVEFPEGTTSVPILMEPLLLAMPTSHRLSGQERVPLAAFDLDAFITPRHAPNVSFHKHTTEACQKAGFIPKFGPQGRDFVTIISMVSIGLGVALVPHSAQCIKLPDVHFAEIGGASVLAELAVAFRKGDHSAAVRAFVQTVRRFASDSPLSDK